MIDIRPATDADRAPVTDLFWHHWSVEVASFADADRLVPHDRAWADELWTRVWPTDTTMVAADGDQVVGVIRYAVGAAEVTVFSLYVAASHRGRGIGAQLLDRTLEAGREQGIASASLWVFAANEAARGFYARQGWRPDGAERTEDEIGMPELRLTRTDADLDRIAALLIDHAVCVDDTEAPPPGAVIGVRDGSGDRIVAAGRRDPDGAPMTPATIVDLASVSKLLTTAGIMHLVDRGEIDLDAGIDRYLGGIADPVPTVRQVLQHRSGLLPWQPLYLQASTRDDALALIRTLPRKSAPDVAFAYSDFGFMLLGEIIETLTGAMLHDALAQMIIDPLGIAITGRPTGEVAASSYGSRVEKIQVETGVPYEVIIDGAYDFRTDPLIGEVNDSNSHACFAGRSGHAGLFASVEDLLALGTAFATTDHGLWRRETLTEFTTPGPDPAQGLGFRLRDLPDGRRMVWHPGFTGTALCVVPDPTGDAPTVVALATNRLLHRSVPIPTTRLLERLLHGVGLLDGGDDHD